MKAVTQIPLVRIDGINVEPPLSLESVRVVQRLNAPSQCQISWLAATLDIRAVEDTGLAPGADIQVHIEGCPGTIFTGEVTAVEHLHQPSGGFELRIRAYDSLVRLQRSQSLETHVDITVVELARTLCDAAGLAVDASDTGPVWSRIVPRFKHDMAMLRHYTARSGLHFRVEGNKLLLFSLGHDADGSVELRLGDNLVEARLEQNDIRLLTTVKVTGWDIHTGESRQGSAGPSGTAQETRSLLGRPLESDGEADALARRELEHNIATATVFWGVADGDTTLCPGRGVHVRGVAAGKEGPYFLTTVTHTIDADGGFLTEMSSWPDPPDEPVVPVSTVLAEVVDIDDPENRGRVQVSQASFSGAVSTWMLVLQQSAGTGKGFAGLPEVGDQVLVALPDGDPSRGVVLGSLYAAEGPPHEPAAGDKQHFPYTLATRGGQWMQLKDSDGSIRLENAGGSYLALTPDGIVLHAAGGLTLEAPGQQLRLRANRIDLDQG